MTRNRRLRVWRTTTGPTKTARRPPKRGCEDSRRQGRPTQVSLPAVAARAPPPRPPPFPATRPMNPHIWKPSAPNFPNSVNSASRTLTCPCKNLPNSSIISMTSKRQRGGGTARIDQGAPSPLRRALGAKALVGTSGTTVTESSVTSGGGIPGSATSAGGVPGSVTLVTDLLRDPGGKKEWQFRSSPEFPR